MFNSIHLKRSESPKICNRGVYYVICRWHLRTHRVGYLGLSGSLFLGLLVLDFDHPTNRGLYLVGRGCGVFLGKILTFFKVVWIILILFGHCFRLSRPTSVCIHSSVG